jgi:GNAT superfamily N-acetyltransferase
VKDAVLDGLSVEEREGTWLNRLSSSDEGSFTLVAERDGNVVGFCSVAAPSRDDDAGGNICELAAIHVDPDIWRGGIGSALFTEALGRAREDGWIQITLWVFTENARARAFYSRFGLAPDGAERQPNHSFSSEVRLRVSLTA